jgi:integrase
MLARRLPGILPPLSFEEALEVTQIHSVAGLLKDRGSLLSDSSGAVLCTERPYRSPHHSASGPSLVGGGSFPRPGEISLAHRGVLFLFYRYKLSIHINNNNNGCLGVVSLSCKPFKLFILFMGAKVFESVQRLSNGEQLVRWHLLDENYQLIKSVERFLRSKQRARVAVGTLKTYAEKLKAFWKYLEVKEIEWENFSSSLIDEFGYWYLTGGLLLDEKVVSPKPEEILAARNERTVNLALTVVVQFYDFHTSIGTVEDKELRKYRTPRRTKQRGKLAGYIKQSPTETTQLRYKESKHFPGCLTSEQVRILIDACSTARDKLILWLLADTGMRRGELLGVHQSDLDWTARTIKIVRRNNLNHAYVKGKERELSIADLLRDREFCEILTEYTEQEYPREVVERLGHDMLFVVLHRGSPSYGKPLEPQNLNKLLKRLHKKTAIDLKRVYPHLFRHTHATHNIRAGRQKGKDKLEVAKSVQRQLGHNSMLTTLEVYDHSFAEAELAEGIERVVKSE